VNFKKRGKDTMKTLKFKMKSVPPFLLFLQPFLKPYKLFAYEKI